VARIQPGTMPVPLTGVGRALKAVSPRRWQPSQIAVMREAERLREKRERGESLDPREIQAWVQLAQTVLGDQTLIGGVVNLISRQGREKKIKEHEASRLAAEATEAARLQEEAQAAAAVPAPPAAPAAPPISYETEYLRKYAPIPSDPPPLAAPAGPAVEEPAPAPAAPAPEAAAPAPTPPQYPPGSMAALYQQEQEVIARDMEEINRMAREKRVTVTDLFAMAAGARSPEAIRRIMRLVPIAIEQDPAFAPRSVVELLFGGASAAPGISKQLVDTWVTSMRTRRGLSPEERFGRRERGRSAGARATETEQDILHAAQDRPTETRTAVARAELTEAQADATRALAAKRRAEAARLVAKNKRAKKWKNTLGRRPATKGIPDDKRDLLALYATWADTKDKTTITEGPWAAKGGKAMGAASASALADRLLLANVDAKSADFKALERSINHVRKEIFRPPTPKTPTATGAYKQWNDAYKKWEKMNARRVAAEVRLTKMDDVDRNDALRSFRADPTQPNIYKTIKELTAQEEALKAAEQRLKSDPTWESK
jgi:hypothetical protein